MAKQHVGWDWDAKPEAKEILSERDYNRLIVRVEDFDGYERRLNDVDLYVDTENGIVVANVAQYESWLKRNRVDRTED